MLLERTAFTHRGTPRKLWRCGLLDGSDVADVWVVRAPRRRERRRRCSQRMGGEESATTSSPSAARDVSGERLGPRAPLDGPCMDPTAPSTQKSIVMATVGGDVNFAHFTWSSSLASQLSVRSFMCTRMRRASSDPISCTTLRTASSVTARGWEVSSVAPLMCTSRLLRLKLLVLDGAMNSTPWRCSLLVLLPVASVRDVPTKSVASSCPKWHPRPVELSRTHLSTVHVSRILKTLRA